MENNTFNLGIAGFRIPPKILLIMRLIIVIMSTFILQASAVTGFAQKLTMRQNQASLKEIFTQINLQTGYDVVWKSAQLKNTRAIDVNFKNKEVVAVLEEILPLQNLGYTISDKTIVIKEKEPSALEKIRSFFSADSVIFKGRVYDGYGMPLAGASVKIKGTKKATFTTKEGYFAIFGASDAILQVSYIGYITQELQMRREDRENLVKFNMVPSTESLGEVAIVSTGYQDLPKERATGSFQTITAKQLQHSSDPNLLKRLEGITTGLDFNNSNVLYPTNSSKFKAPPLAGLTIRGKNNLQSLISTDPNQASGQPLVVIDGIASPYSIDKINPNDVESINILQDAAAASIWGSRAANGVIVVKTKRGAYNRPLSVSFNSNVNITDKIDLFYRKTMSSSDFVDAQLAKLDYDYSQDPVTLDDPIPEEYQNIISPVAEIWTAFKKERIELPEFNDRINALKKNDVRNDLSNYFFRKAITQNYSLGIDGGTGKYAYRLSAGYDKILNNTIASGSNRISINYNASVKILKNLDVDGGITYNQQNRDEQGAGTPITGESIYPYTRLIDDQGNPAVIPRTYRPGFLEVLAEKHGNRILDMTFKPLADINEGYTKYKSQLMNLNLNLTYRISPVFTGTLTYNNAWGQDDQLQLMGQNSYFMRTLINKFTDPNTDPYQRAIPLGGLYMPTNGKSNNQTLRAQFNANKTWAEKHVLSAIAGVDGGEDSNSSRDAAFYGYNEKTKKVNNALPFGVEKNLLFIDPNTGFTTDPIPYFPELFTDYRVRTFNVYANAAYTYDKRYTLSASIRNDASSIFGRATNKYGASYFSAGVSWAVNNEKFYHLDWLPRLQLKAAFGYNGNVNATVSPVPVISYQTSFTGNLLPYATTLDGLNRLLRPEKAGMLNLGLAFGSRNERISGSVEYYVRKTTDLIATTSLDPSTGFNVLAYNAANLHGSGVDATLSTINLKMGNFSWTSNLLFSNNCVKVTRLYTNKPNTAQQQINGNPRYNEGAELSRLYAYRWAGLDPETGDPMGYLDGKAVRVTGETSVYNSIGRAPASTARYFGSSVPVYYGGFRNTFNYGSFSISANFLYKLGYYFRRSANNVVRYSLLFNDNMLQGEEYARRWQKPGDEKFTNVPSVVFPVVPGGITENRDAFYYYSEINVLKADHIRLQEINLSYALKTNNFFIKNPRIYANVTNLGIVWRANKQGIDPDINDYPNPRAYSFGLSANF